MDTIEIRVDGVRRVRYEIDDLLSRLVPDADCSMADRESLGRWKEWLIKWKRACQAGDSFTQPQPTMWFTRYRTPEPEVDPFQVYLGGLLSEASE